MFPRREPLLWLQCLAIGVIPLELLLIRLALAGADPGPVPELERILTWGISVVGPALILWKRPADWASLVLLRLPISNRSAEQQHLSATQAGAVSRVPLVIGAVALLLLLWWLDDSAVLVREFSPLAHQSRLASLLVSAPLLTLALWQIQQLGQALHWLIQAKAEAPVDPQPFPSAQLDSERTSLGLQLLNLPLIEWPERAPTPTPTPTPTVSAPEAPEATQPEPKEQSEQQDNSSADDQATPLDPKRNEAKEPKEDDPGNDAVDQPGTQNTQGSTSEGA